MRFFNQNFRRRLIFFLQSFLFTFDAANASDEFLLKEGQAFIKLWIGSIKVLTNMQIAIVSTTCRPLVPHLPDVCNLLLNGPNSNSYRAIEVQGSYGSDDAIVPKLEQINEN
jgi:hypothetical protein